MRKPMLLWTWLIAVTIFLVAASSAQAVGDNLFSYVSHSGSDGANCNSPATACQTFNHALAETANYGEIDCVDAGNYYNGLLEIEQPVTIDCAGGVGSTAGSIVVNAPGSTVRFRNLTFNNNGQGLIAVNAENVLALYVENCVITNFNAGIGALYPYIGIKFGPSANAQLFVSNSVISNNGSSDNSLSGGIYIVPGSGVTAEVSIDHSQINGNYFGVVGDGRSGGIIKGTISDSVVSGSTENGITAISSGSSVVFMIDQTKITNNSAAGLFSSGSNAGMLARNSTVYGNAIGLDAASGGALYTYGNNSVNGNTTNGAFTGTAALQ
jgi:hypothetical protein